MELIVTIGVFALVGGVIISIFISTITSRAKAHAHIEAQEQARFALERMTYELRRARGLEATTDYGVNIATSSGTSLDLDMSVGGNDPTSFTVVSGILYITQGAGAAVALTSDDVSVTNLTVDNRSTANGRSENVKVTLTVHKGDPTGQADSDVDYTLRTAVELRGE